MNHPAQARMSGADRRDELLKAAAALFGERGYALASIDAIGARAGVTGPAVYRHFSGKRDLLLTLLGQGVDRAMADVEAALAAHDDPAARLGALVERIVAHAIAERQVVGLLYAQLGALEPAERSRAVALRERIVAAWIEALAGARPDLGAADLALYVGAALSLVSGIALRAPDPAGPAVQRAYARMMRALLAA